METSAIRHMCSALVQADTTRLPFSVAIRADGRRIRFHRSIEATVASIAEINQDEADVYVAFMDIALPVVENLKMGIWQRRSRSSAGIHQLAFLLLWYYNR